MVFQISTATTPLQPSRELLILLLQRIRLAWSRLVVACLGCIASLGWLLWCRYVSTQLVVRVRHSSTTIPLNAQFQQLREDLAEILEERVFILRVQLDVLPEAGIFGEDDVGGQHHELGLGILIVVDELLNTIRQDLLLPLQRQQQFEILVGESGWVVYPDAIEARPVCMAASKVVSARERHNLLVVKAHSVEDPSNMVGSLRGIGQSSSWW